MTATSCLRLLIALCLLVPVAPLWGQQQPAPATPTSAQAPAQILPMQPQAPAPAPVLPPAGRTQASVDEGMLFQRGAGQEKLVDILLLSQPWKDSTGREYRPPFLVQDQQMLDISTSILLQDAPQKPLYLFFEGLAWEAEIYFDQALLTLSNQPFAPLQVPIPAQLATKGWHSLRVVLRKPTGLPSFSLMPRMNLGIHRPAFVLAATDSAYRVLPRPAHIPKADTAAVLAPYDDSLGYLIPQGRLDFYLYLIKKQGIRTVYFPYTPTRAMEQQVAAAGFAIVDTLPPVVAYINGYPTADGIERPFWLGTDGLKTASWGQYFPSGYQPIQPFDNIQALLLLLLPLVLMVAWKLTDASSFGMLFSLSAMFSLGGRKVLDMIRQQQLLRGQALLWTTLLLVSLMAALLVFAVQFVTRFGLYANAPGAPTLTHAYHSLLVGGAGTLQLWGVTLLVVTAVTMGKLLLLSVLAGIYGLKGFVPRLLALDVYAAMPLLAVVAAVGFGVNLSEIQAPVTVATLCFWLFVVYLLRRYVILVRGLLDALELPLVAAILYICVLELLPILWFAAS